MNVRETLVKFMKKFIDYGGQPNVFLLITYHLDDPSYQAIIRVCLNADEAQYWLTFAEYPGQGKKIQKVLLYKVGEV